MQLARTFPAWSRLVHLASDLLPPLTSPLPARPPHPPRIADRVRRLIQWYFLINSPDFLARPRCIVIILDPETSRVSRTPVERESYRSIAALQLIRSPRISI